MFLKSFKCPAQGKCNELGPAPEHISLAHPPDKNPKRAQNLSLHAYKLMSRSGVSQKIPIIYGQFLDHIFKCETTSREVLGGILGP